MKKYKLTQNGTKVGVYENGSLALEAMEKILDSLDGSYHAKINHTTPDCETGFEVSVLIYQNDNGEQQVFLVEEDEVIEE